MLNLLLEYAKTHNLVTEPGFTSKQVRWAIEVSSDGKATTVIPLGDAGAMKNHGRTFSWCPDLSQPELVGGTTERCHFLIETAQVIALIFKDDEEQDVRVRIQNKHQYFVRQLRDASTALPGLLIAAEVLAAEDGLQRLRQEMQQLKVKPADKVTLRIDGEFPLDGDAWHDWWRQYRKGLSTHGAAKPIVPCFATGRLVQPAATHPLITGLVNVGGQPTGDRLICFDKESSQSYCFEQSANAAVGEAAAAAYRAALNDLLCSHSRRVGGTKLAYWFRDSIPEVDDPLMAILGDDLPDEDRSSQERDALRQVAELMAGIEAGKRPELLRNRYYAITLSGAAGRIMVRDWMDGDFGELVRNVVAWFHDLQIVHRDGHGLAPPPKFYAVLGATVRELDDLTPPFVAKMWRVAVRREPIPGTALAACLRRFYVKVLDAESINHACMGLIKAYHIRKGGNMDTGLRPHLNEEHPHPAYHCGRLMAVLAALQRAALGDVGAGVVQRYYAAASATPGLVIGRLVRTGQFHLGKLDGGLAHWYEDKLGAISVRIGDAAPVTLNLEEQSLFALGYYQQLVDLRTKKNIDANQTGKE